MTTEVSKQQKIVCMKTGLPIFLDLDRAANLEQLLAGGSGHKFIKIDDQMINSAEIEGVYTVDQYDELQKIKQGSRKCIYGVWHGKKEVCTCKEDLWKQEQEKKREEEYSQSGETEEQRLRNIQRIKEIKEEFIKKGVFGMSSRRYKVKRSEMVKYKEKHGIEYEVPDGTEIIED